MKRLLAVSLAVLWAAGCWAQGDGVTQGERAKASMMILLLVIVGMLLTYGLMWVLRIKGKLAEEKPRERAIWVHPEDEQKHRQ